MKIVVADLFQRGTSHAPFSSAFLETISEAFPAHELVFIGYQSHLAELSCLRNSGASAQIKFIGIDEKLSAPQGNFVQRTWSRLHWLKHNLVGQFPSDTMFVLSSAYADEIWAAKLLHRITLGRFKCQLVLHGVMSDIVRPRSRHPIRRNVDFVASLMRLNCSKIRFLVLEHAIERGTREILPDLGPYLDSIPHPGQPEQVSDKAVPFDACIRFGFLGIASKAKGIDAFVRMASTTRARHGDRAEFHAIGRLPVRHEQFDTGPLSSVPQATWMERAEFLTQAARMHYVCLPYEGDYYQFSASGVALDALNLRKPLIARDVPMIRDLFELGGDIGYLCRGEDEMTSTADRIVREPDYERYLRQVEAVVRLSSVRRPKCVATEYRSLLEQKFGLT